jgi:predicted DCC family thiol-disulfide oxidoreductase YuxK
MADSYRDIVADPRPVVLFDGLCTVCDASVQAILKRDTEGVFRFASLQGEFGREVLKRNGLPADELQTLILLEDGKTLFRSTAVLRILRRLGGFWRLSYALRFIPVALRDSAYRLFARNRHKFFGRKETCRIPTAEVRSRFID